MTMAVTAAGAVVRLIDLTFQITGISEQNERIRDVMRQANILVTVLTTVVMLQRMVVAGVFGGPMGVLMGVVSVGGMVPTIMNEFYDTEEVISRGK